MKINPGDFYRAAIRHTIHEFYVAKKYPSLNKLLVQLREKNMFNGGHSPLAKLLNTMGLYRTREDGKRYVYEQPRVIQQQHNYLHRMRCNREEEIFLGSTLMQLPKSCGLTVTGPEDGNIPVAKANASSSYMLDLKGSRMFWFLDQNQVRRLL